LPNFSQNGEKDEIPNGLILLGDIPEPRFGLMFVPVIGHRKGVNLYWRVFTDGSLKKHDQIALIYLGITSDENYLYDLKDSGNLGFQIKMLGAPRAYSEIEKALICARSARFEHGERG
jgi:hypothetical protein